jgi:hypothetical protein
MRITLIRYPQWFLTYLTGNTTGRLSEGHETMDSNLQHIDYKTHILIGCTASRKMGVELCLGDQRLERRATAQLLAHA